MSSLLAGPNPFRAPTPSRLPSPGTVYFLGGQDSLQMVFWEVHPPPSATDKEFCAWKIHAFENMLGAEEGGNIFKGMCVGATPVSAGHEGLQSPKNRRRQEVSSQHQFSMLLKTVSRAAQVAQRFLLETRDQVPHRAPRMEPASPSACVSASLSLS